MTTKVSSPPGDKNLFVRLLTVMAVGVAAFGLSARLKMTCAIAAR
jgi:hypothetical protein